MILLILDLGRNVLINILKVLNDRYPASILNMYEGFDLAGRGLIVLTEGLFAVLSKMIYRKINTCWKGMNHIE
jgi:hypothetical protein